MLFGVLAVAFVSFMPWFSRFFYLYLLRLFFEWPHSACWAEGAAWFSYVNIVVLFKLFIPFLTHFENFCPVFVIRSTPLFFTSPWSAHFRWSSQNEQAFLNMECLSKLSARMDAIANLCIRYFCAALLFVCLFVSSFVLSTIGADSFLLAVGWQRMALVQLFCPCVSANFLGYFRKSMFLANHFL